jgi:hypothetical protein
MSEPSRAHEASPSAALPRWRAGAAVAALPWVEKQAAYAARRAEWDRGQALIEAERIRLHGMGKP